MFLKIIGTSHKKCLQSLEYHGQSFENNIDEDPNSFFCYFNSRTIEKVFSDILGLCQYFYSLKILGYV